MDNSRHKEKERGITKDNSEGMNTKEAVEFLENSKNNYWDCNVKYGEKIKLTKIKVNEKVIDIIIKLLKRGEKYEKMYNKIKFIAGFNISVDEERDQVRAMLEEYVKNMKVKRIIIQTNGKGDK